MRNITTIALMINAFAAALAVVATTSACSAVAKPPPASPLQSTPDIGATAPLVRTGYAAINGLRYYYEIHGAGEPLLLLHGGMMSIDSLGPVLPALATTHQVIAVDLQGHGRTALGDRPISMLDIADDLAALLDQLGYAQVDAVGYSLGGTIAFRLAVQHPTKVRRLVVVSGAFARDAVYPEMLPLQAQVGAGMAEMMKATPIYAAYAAVAPHPEQFPLLLNRLGVLMRTPYDWAADVQTLTMPVLLVYGDSDMVRLEHAVATYHLLGGGLRDPGWGREHMAQNRLAIIPDATHYDIMDGPALVSTVVRYLDGATPDPASASADVRP